MTRHEDRVFFPLGHTSRTSHVLARLRAAILDGSLKAGTSLPEERLAASLGVSRAPVREALRSLEEEGLVTKTAYRGAVVATTCSDALSEATSVRVRVEPYAIERSLPVFMADSFGEMDERLRRLADCALSGDVSSTVDAHDAFHRAFYENADHHLLLDAWRTLEPVVRMHLLSADWSSPLTRAWIRSHEALLNVIKSGSPPAISQAVTHHLAGTGSSTRADHERDS